MGFRLEKSAPTGEQQDLLRAMYAYMLRARLVDTAAWTAYQQGQLGFVASCRGHEAAQVGSALCIEVGQDFTLPYYRDLGVVLTIGMTPEEVFRTYLQARQVSTLAVQQETLQAAAKQEAEDEQQPRHPTRPVAHWGYHKHNLVTAPAPVATQIMHAAGIAFACKLRKSSAVTIAYCGDGATAEPDFREGITFAAQHQLPALFICEQDSSPDRPSTLSALSLPAGLHYERVDGSDVLGVYIVTQEALQRARAGHGPTLLEITVTRATPVFLALTPTHDPLTRCQQFLQQLNAWDETWASELESRLRQEVEQALADVLLSGIDCNLPKLE
ncbi:MAG TPA: thiamine pyrophosphate-dependent dehydrogenase E1 component subunit alpha [Ktedonobacteraceae bacterium]